MSRCSAITKAKSQCSRPAKIGLYCGQHAVKPQPLMIGEPTTRLTFDAIHSVGLGNKDTRVGDRIIELLALIKQNTSDTVCLNLKTLDDVQPIAEFSDLPDLTQDIQKLMKQVHPNGTLSANASTIIQACLTYVYDNMKSSYERNQWGLGQILDTDGELYCHAIAEINKNIYKLKNNINNNFYFSIRGHDAKQDVAMISCLEYLTAEMLELSGFIAQDHADDLLNFTVDDVHIYNAVKQDKELNNVFKHVLATLYYPKEDQDQDVINLSQRLGSTNISPTA
jgi:hypothetical protein